MRVIDVKTSVRPELEWPLQIAFLASALHNDVAISRDENYRYHDADGTRYVSVSQVMRDIGLAKSFDAVKDLPVVAHAAERGKVVEQAIFDALASGDPEAVIFPDEWIPELTEPSGKPNHKATWVDGYWNWLTDRNPKFVSARQMVGDPEILVAGEIDLVLDEDGPPAILRINPSLHGGYEFLEYPNAHQVWGLARSARLDAIKRYAMTRAKIERILK